MSGVTEGNPREITGRGRKTLRGASGTSRRETDRRRGVGASVCKSAPSTRARANAQGIPTRLSTSHPSARPESRRNEGSGAQTPLGTDVHSITFPVPPIVTQSKANHEKRKHLILRLGHLRSSYNPLYLIVVRWIRLCFIHSYNRVHLPLNEIVITLPLPIQSHSDSPRSIGPEIRGSICESRQLPVRLGKRRLWKICS